MINNVTLVGRLTKDPALQYTPSGVAVARFTLAVNRPFSNQQGDKEADFINCTVWRKPAENVANFLSKGSLAGVVGRIQTGSYEGQDGKRVYTTEVVAESVQFLEPRSNNQGSNQGSGAGPGRGANGMSEGHEPPRNWQAETGIKSPVDDPFSNQGPVEVSDDDLPF